MKTLRKLQQLSLAYLIIPGSVCVFMLLSSFWNDPGILQSLLTRLVKFHESHQQQKVYVHVDKPYYAAGDNVWFKAYVVEASLHQLDSQSRVLYVELLNENKDVINRKVAYISSGVAFGDMVLSDSLHEGKYLLRAYTNYMKNTPDDFFFNKEISIVSARSNTEANSGNELNLDSIDVQFFPEGGNLVACGIDNKIAFKAIGPDGKSIAVEGEIIDDRGEIITTFTTAHAGMGAFILKPTYGKAYKAQITKPYRLKRTIALPKVLEKGYVLQLTETAKTMKVVIVTNVDKPAGGNLVLNLIAQSRGKAYHAQQAVIVTNATFTYIPKSKFPDGITQLTLFDPEGRPVAERLMYRNQNEIIQIDTRTDKPSYDKRQPVTITATTKYLNGASAPGYFSVSVYDDKVMNTTEKYPLTITNYLSLTSDLKGNIEEPGYYFKDTLPDTKKHLDLLMMTQGWRRFTWQDVLQQPAPSAYNYKHESGIPISGLVKKPVGKSAPEESIVKVVTMAGEAVAVKPDSLGRFYTDAFLFFDSMKFVFQTENEKGKKKPYKFLLDPFSPPSASTHNFTAFTRFRSEEYLQLQYEQKVIDNANLGTQTKQLQEIEVTASRVDNRKPGSMLTSADKVINVSKEGANFIHIFELIQSKVPGAVVDGNPPNMTVKIRNQVPVFLTDGAVMDAQMIGMISPNMVESIEIARGGAAVMYGGSSVINLVLKKGALERVPVGVNTAHLQGFHTAREFYSPRYDVPDDRHNLQDSRTTLYWNPVVKVGNDGAVMLTFFTADASSRYRVVFEGITPDGYPGSGSTFFEVK